MPPKPIKELNKTLSPSLKSCELFKHNMTNVWTSYSPLWTLITKPFLPFYPPLLRKFRPWLLPLLTHPSIIEQPCTQRVCHFPDGSWWCCSLHLLYAHLFISFVLPNPNSLPFIQQSLCRPTIQPTYPILSTFFHLVGCPKSSSTPSMDPNP